MIDTDAVVFCTGAATPRLLKDVLKLGCPVLPVKSYSFDIPTQYSPFAFQFDAFTAVWLKQGVLRINAGGDLAGNSTSFDQRRVRNILNITAKTLDTQDTMKH